MQALTPELFDAMFDNEHFRARLKARWQEMEADKKAEDDKAYLANVRTHGTENILREEFFNRPNATEAEIDARRQELLAEFDKRFG